MNVLRVCFAHVRLGVALALLTSVSANAATPQLINYQGILTNPGGTPQVGTFNVTFSIYPTPAGGSPIWSEPQSVTTDNEGRFNVLLGTATTLTDAVFSGPDRWLGVSVSPDGELTPRTQIVSVAYAERISTVDGAAGGTISGNLKVGPNDTVFTSNLSSNSPLRLQTAGTTRMYIDDAGGNVGIGTTSPNVPLHVNSSSDAEVGRFQSNTAQPYLSLWYGTFEGARIQTVNDVSDGGSLRLFTAAPPFGSVFERMRITSAGNVGIGTTSPEAPLSFANTLGNKIFIWNGGLTDRYGIGLQSSLLQMFTGSAASAIAFGHGHSSSFTELMRINGNGNVGIGTTTPAGKLEVKTEAGVNRVTLSSDLSQFNLLTFNRGGVTQGEIGLPALANDLYFRAGGAERMRIQGSDGRVGIGTTTPTEALHVIGNICATGTIGACSDARFKSAVKPIEGSLDKIEKLQGVTYRWNRDKYPQFAEGNQIGFVAQKVKEVLPEVVSEGSDGTLSVDYGRFSVVLLEAIKEQQKQIEELKVQVAALGADKQDR